MQRRTPPSNKPFDGFAIGLAGPMLGSNPGWVTSQHEILAEQFHQEGAVVRTTSATPGRLERLIDTVWTVGRWRRRVDVVIIAVFSGPGFWIADVTSRIARWLRIPQVLVLHGGNLPEFRRRHPRAVEACLARAEEVVAPSRYLASRIPTKRPVRVIPNTFDVSAIPFRERRQLQPRLLWMRTFHPIYNPQLAIESLAVLRATHPDATLTMAGQDKGSLDDCVRRANELGVDDAVTFPGYLDEGAKRSAFEFHDVFLNTNDVDNTPVSVLEAAAAGLPVVATEVGGLPYLLEDQTSALLVPPGDATAVAQAVDRLVTDTSLAARLSRNGHRRAMESDWTAVGPQWSAVLKAVGRRSEHREETPRRDAEQARIEAVYAGYTDSGRPADRWDPEAPGNRVNLETRRRAVESLLRPLPNVQRVLEVGCGNGDVMIELRGMLGDETSVTGVDLLMDRLATATDRKQTVLLADGRNLPFGDKTFDLVAAFTVFSSILDERVQQQVASEMGRVLSDTGVLLWYDFRLPSPNRSVRRLTKSDVEHLFPSMRCHLHSTSLLPPVARKLGPFDRHLTPWLLRVPFLRSHLLGLLEP